RAALEVGTQVGDRPAQRYYLLLVDAGAALVVPPVMLHLHLEVDRLLADRVGASSVFVATAGSGVEAFQLLVQVRQIVLQAWQVARGGLVRADGQRETNGNGQGRQKTLHRTSSSSTVGSASGSVNRERTFSRAACDAAHATATQGFPARRLHVAQLSRQRKTSWARETSHRRHQVVARACDLPRRGANAAHFAGGHACHS